MTTVDVRIEHLGSGDRLYLHNGLWGSATKVLHAFSRACQDGRIPSRKWNIAEINEVTTGDVRAGAIDGAQAKILPDDKGEPVHMVVVTNGSKRPVREVTVKIEAIQADESIRHQKLADLWGVMETYALGSTARAQTFVPTERSSTMPVLRAGQTAAFIWGFTTALYPRLLSWVRFTDDAGLHWEIDTSLHLEKLAKRDW